MKYFLTILFAVSSVPLSAQWPSYPTPGVPRTADGKPNLSAPAPRGPDGKPDLSGVWDTQNRGGSQFINIVPSVPGGLPYRPGMAEMAKNRAAPPRTTEPITRCLPTGILVQHTWPGWPYRRKIRRENAPMISSRSAAGSMRTSSDTIEPSRANPDPDPRCANDYDEIGSPLGRGSPATGPRRSPTSSTSASARTRRT